MARLPRLLSLALLFSSRRRLRAEDAARQFGVSVRTVYRDMAALEEAGFPLVGTPGDGYHLSSGAHLRPLAVTPEEAEALVMAARLLQTSADATMEQHLASARLKLEAALTPEAVARVKRQDVTVRVPTRFEAGPLSTILDAIHHRVVLRLAYAGLRRQDTTERDVEPLGLVRSGRFWLMPAWCRLRSDLRVFRSDRILSATRTAEVFTPREGATMEDLVRQHLEESAPRSRTAPSAR
jgi:predicted DNA-binding transcriptional regulator YafY